MIEKKTDTRLTVDPVKALGCWKHTKPDSNYRLVMTHEDKEEGVDYQFNLHITGDEAVYLVNEVLVAVIGAGQDKTHPWYRDMVEMVQSRLDDVRALPVEGDDDE